MSQQSAIKPTRAENFPDWYQAVVDAGDLAETSEVRGCMVIKPWGYAIWERIQLELDRRFKATGHKNAYFPLFIPLSYMEKEAEHVAGFAKECAVVTHHRLEAGPDGKLQAAGPLTEPLVIRPTSETIIGAAFARWVRSWRDLPLLINQWANIVRWEMRTRVFLRTTEFLWQEGHTAHESEREAREETAQMLAVYEEVARTVLAVPVLTGVKTAGERFPGAVDTYCIEAMVQDRKAVQAGTSHFLGQNFAKASGIKFQSRESKEEFAWTTSWGVSTRLIGTVIMAHSDDDGLVLPPRIAPAQVVIIPIAPKPETQAQVFEACEKLAAELRAQSAFGDVIRVEVDKRDMNGGAKSWEWIRKGVPLRVEIGARDIAQGTVFVGRRDKGAKEKQSIPSGDFAKNIGALLQEIQDAIYDRALSFRNANLKVIESKEEFYAFFTPRNEAKPEIHGGFALAHWDGSTELEAKIKEDLKVTIRCLPTPGTVAEADAPGTCIFTGKPSAGRAVFAKSY
jgi:prolyl-tRNA synthetase